jgi:hypothetical protein
MYFVVAANNLIILLFYISISFAEYVETFTTYVFLVSSIIDVEEDILYSWSGVAVS